MAQTDPADTVFAPADAVGDAVLYEGYLLYPYRRSSGKNRVRWQFGVLAPREWIAAHGVPDTGVAGSAEAWFSQTECLLRAPEDAEEPKRAEVRVRVRFLQLRERTVEERTAAGFHPVEALRVDGQTHIPFTEAVPREHDVVADVAGLLTGEHRSDIEVPGEEVVETLTGASGHVIGRVVRRHAPLSAAVRLSVVRAGTAIPAYRLRVRVENTAVDLARDAHRDDALRRALVSTHTCIATNAGSFLSLLDPPGWGTAAARECDNVHTFPVLVGDADPPALILSSPILLYDHPQIAPESPGDLHDAAEIDELLSLRTLTLTDTEKAEARATDARAAAIVDRVDAMPPEVFDRLHGTIRSGAPEQPDTPVTPWWEPGGDAEVSPESDCVLVDGVRVGNGSRVRLRPRARADAHDMFLAGRLARVAKVLLDVDGSRHVAVTLDDDPGADMLEWYGRFFHFGPDEVEPTGEAAQVVR